MRRLPAKLFAGCSVLSYVAALGLLCSSTSLSASANEDVVERAARKYRMQVFQTFRTKRSEYDRRLAAGREILQQWQSRGAPAEESPALIDWFARATKASRLHTIDRLPAYSTPSSKPRAVTPDKKPMPRRIHPPTRRPRTVQRRRDSDPTIAPADPFLPPKSGPDWTLPRAGQSSGPDGGAPLTLRLESPVPLGGRETSGRVTSPAPSARVTGTAADIELPHRRVVDVPEPTPDWPAPKTIVRRVPIPEPATLAGGLAQAVTHSHDEIPDLETGSPRSPDTPTGADPAPAADLNGPTESGVSPINLAVLAARIRASNLHVSEIDSELTENGLWDSQRLRPLVDRFNRMLSGRRLSQLYYDALDPTERQRVTTFSPIGPTKTMLIQRLFEARVAAAGDLVFFPPDSKEVDELRSLAQTVDSWSIDIPANDN